LSIDPFLSLSNRARSGAIFRPRQIVPLIFLVHLFIASLTLALDVPALQHRVSDLARMIDESTSSQLEENLRQFEEQTHHQIAVLTIPSLNGDSLEDFSIRVAEAWKIGHKGVDDGVILIVARDDRKIRIEVGYGLEGVLPDATANRIIQEIMISRFRAQDFAGGITDGLSAIEGVIRGESMALASPRTEKTAPIDLSKILPLLLGTTFFGTIIGIAQPSLLRGAMSGALVSSLIGLPAVSVVGIGVWLVGICIGALASILTIRFTRRAWGRSWSVQPSRRDDFSPRDLMHRGYGGGGSGGHGGGGSVGGSGGGFSGGGGGFGGGGASGGW